MLGKRIDKNSLEKLLFYLFIFLLPSQLAKHFWISQSFVYGIRVDFLAPTIYLTDIILFLLLTLWFLGLNKIIVIKLINKYILNPWLVCVVVLLIFNIYYSLSPVISLIKWFKLTEVILLVIYVVEKKDLNLVKQIMIPLIYSSIVFSTIGIFQFYFQKTIGGFFYFLGERSFTSETTGIAKVTILGKEYMRTYSTFPHPNSMAGYICTVNLLFIGFYKETRKYLKHYIMVLFFLTGALAVILTFSKVAIVSYLVIILFYLVQKYYKHSYGKLLKYAVYIFGIASFLMIAIPVGNFQQNVYQRLVLNSAAVEVFFKHPLVGVGLNNFILKLPNLDLQNIQWILQPVHNIYLLVLAETGLFGFILFIVFLNFLLLYSINNKSILYVFLFILLTALFDHYFFTIQQNTLIFAIVAGIVIRTKTKSVVVLKRYE